MSSGSSRLRDLCLGLVAFAWPWGAYEALPVVFRPVSALLLAILTLLAAKEAFDRRSLTIPFELAWPLAAVGALTAIHAAFVGSLTYFGPVAAGVIVFWAAYASADTRETVQRCFRFSVISCVAVSALSLLAQCRPFYGLHLYQVFPTAFDSRTGAVLAFPASLSEGALTLALGALLAVIDIGGPRRSWLRRVAALAFLCLIIAPLFIVISEQMRALGSWSPPAYWQLHPLLIAGVLATAWYAVRISAKLLVAGYDGRDCEMLLFAGLPLLAVLFAAAFPAALHCGHIATIALAARSALLPAAQSDAAPLRRWPRALACVALLPLFVWNIFHVDSHNTRDPRNYEAIARRYPVEAHPWPLFRALYFINERVPSERRTWFWSARTALRNGRLEEALRDFRRALEAPGGPASILPPPSASDIEKFLEEVRDLCAPLSFSERGLAYERALVLAGQPENALSLLRLRAEHAENLPFASNLFASALAELLWDNRLAPELRLWPSGELLAVLESIGVQVMHAPVGFPAGRLPAILMGYRAGKSLLLRVWTPRENVGVDWRAYASLQSDGISHHWSDIERAADAEWVISLLDDKDVPLLRLKLGEVIEWSLPEDLVLEGCPGAFRPALLVLLP